VVLNSGGKRKKREKRGIICKIVATFVYASSQGQRTHSAWTKKLLMLLLPMMISVIDYFIVCQDLYSLVTGMVVDEEKKHVLKRYYKRNGNIKVINSDHNILVLNICYPWDIHVRKERTEIFNLRNKKCQEDFYHSTNNTNVLTKSLENKDVLTAGKHWLKRMKTLIHQNFRKVRITSQKKESKVEELLSMRKSDGDDEEIAEEIYKRNKALIIEQIGNMSDHTGNKNRLKIWKVKQKVCPKKGQSVPVAKLDEHGNLVCNIIQLQQLYIRVYKDRLRHRTVLPEYTQMNTSLI
jgi:hypothetical protein